MLKFGLILSSLIYLVASNGELVILRSPEKLLFSGNDSINWDDIPEVLAVSLGFSARKPVSWSGLTVKDPFGFAKRLIVVSVDGIPTLGEFDKAPVFPITANPDELKLWNALDEDLREHYPDDYEEREIFRKDFGKLSTELNPDFVKTRNLVDVTDEDLYFFRDLAALQDYASNLSKNEVGSLRPVVNWLVLPGLQSVQTVRGGSDPTILSFKQELRDEIVKMAKSLDDDSLFVVMTGGVGSYIRQVRAAGEGGNNTSTVPGNLATVFTSNYPAIFNIMLWFGVTFVLSLIAISYFIGTMDPGRDSIIYRMTSNRMKKDS